MKVFQPARLVLKMDEEGLSAYRLARLLKEHGYKVSRNTVLAHASGERVPRSETVGGYALVFQISTEFFFTPVPGADE